MQLKATRRSYINWEIDRFFQPQHLWSAVDHNHTDVHRQSVQYLLVPTSCKQVRPDSTNMPLIQRTLRPLCGEDPEHRRHFFLECTALISSCSKYINKHQSFTTENFKEDLLKEISTNNDNFLQLILKKPSSLLLFSYGCTCMFFAASCYLCCFCEPLS